MHIYLITNLVNGKRYVGQTTKTIEERWKEHLKNAKKRMQNRLYQAIRKYGQDAFTAEGLTECDNPEKSNELEKMWIILLNTYNYKSGYNMTVGGDGHPCPCTEDVRRKISKTRQGQPTSQKQKDAASETHKGKPKPLAQRQKMAASWTDERRTKQAGIARQVNSTENRKLRDFKCPDCNREFRQVTKGVYGGHRKSCLFWKDVPEHQKPPRLLSEGAVVCVV